MQVRNDQDFVAFAGSPNHTRGTRCDQFIVVGSRAVGTNYYRISSHCAFDFTQETSNRNTPYDMQFKSGNGGTSGRNTWTRSDRQYHQVSFQRRGSSSGPSEEFEIQVVGTVGDGPGIVVSIRSYNKGRLYLCQPYEGRIGTSERYDNSVLFYMTPVPLFK